MLCQTKTDEFKTEKEKKQTKIKSVDERYSSHQIVTSENQCDAYQHRSDQYQSENHKHDNR